MNEMMINLCTCTRKQRGTLVHSILAFALKIKQKHNQVFPVWLTSFFFLKG